MSILVVEDEQITGKIVELNLKKHGYEVKRVCTGKDALDILDSTLGIELVIADIMMPGISGLDLLERIKTSPHLENIPVIMSTSRQDAACVQKSIQLGCSFYLVKPINAGLLIDKVKSVLGQKQSVLQNKNAVMLRANMDEDAYKTVAIEYYVYIKELVSRLFIAVGSEPGPIDVDFGRLGAGADVLGADFINIRIGQMGGVPQNGIRSISNRAQKILLRDLQEFCHYFEHEFEEYIEPGSVSPAGEESGGCTDRRTG